MFLVWPAFIVLVLTILAFDLGIFSRERKALSTRAALVRTTVYFVLALLFTVFVYFAYENHWGKLGIYSDAVAGEYADVGNSRIPDRTCRKMAGKRPPSSSWVTSWSSR